VFNLTETTPVTQEKAVVIPVVEAVLVIVVTFVLIAFLSVIFYVIELDTGLSLVLSELVILIVPLAYLLYKRVDIKRYVGMDVKPNFVLWGFVSGAILFSVDIAVSAVLLLVFGESKAVIDSNNTILQLSETPSGLIAVATALGLAGVCEEFAFRGFLQNTLTRRYSFTPAVIVSAFVFGLFHFDPQFVYIISAMSGGLVLGYVYHHWNSYVVSTIAHSSVNLVVLVFLLLGV
jgi:membrane protease YdiL (CAAX protease family)